MAYKIHTSEKTGAKVYRDAPNNEFYVVAEGENKSHASTYYTDDKQDAIATADKFGLVVVKTIQEVLNVVIVSGHYGLQSRAYNTPASHYMCDAIGMCHRRDIITTAEKDLVTNTIQEYISYNFSLARVLEQKELPHTFNDRLAIYQDWDNRPDLSNVTVGCMGN